MEQHCGGMAPYDATSGRRRFAAHLRTTTVECDSCGFADAILGGAWRTSVGRSQRSGHTVYHLDCPDCGASRDVEVNLP